MAIVYPIDVRCRFDAMVPIGDIKPNPDNVNQHPDIQLKGLEVTIRENSIRHPLIVSKTSGYLVAGHARLEVFKRIGVEKVPVVYQAFEDKASEFQFMVSDNESQRRSWLDPEKFESSLESFDFKLDSVDLKAFGVYQDVTTDNLGGGAKGTPSERPTKGKGDDRDVPTDDYQDTADDDVFTVTLKYKKSEYKRFLAYLDQCKMKNENLTVSDIILKLVEESY